MSESDQSGQWFSRGPRGSRVAFGQCERVLLPFMGDVPLEEVSASKLFAYRNHLVTKTSRRCRKLSDATVRMYLGDVRAVINHALTLQVLERSPIPPVASKAPGARS